MEQSNSSTNLFDLQIDHQSGSYLSETAKWAKFLSILGFIFCGLILIIAIFFGSFLTSGFFGKYGGVGTGAAAGALGGLFIFIYVIIALIYFFPCLFLFNFSNKMQVAIRNNDQGQLNISFRNLKSFFKFCGIFTIVILGFYLLVLIFALFAGIAAR